MVGKEMWQNKIKGLLALMLALTVGTGLVGCGNRAPAESRPTGASLFSRVTEVSPPATIQDLRPYLDTAQPQVKILSPRANEVITDDQVTVRLQVKDLTLFKDEDLELGPHLHVFLDDEPYRPVYNTADPLVLSDLKPGSHTLRVFASRPWHESFKNEGAYAQTTFHIYTQTAERTPLSDAPLLTYSRPQGSYGAEPVMLDFYLADVPLHLVAQERSDDTISDWQIRCTVNGDSFTVNAWEPLYLKGFKPGKNWVKLELLDEKGNLFPGAFNSAVRLIDYTPGGQDTLSKLVRGEIPVEIARQIVDPNYTPPAPVEPEPVEPEPIEPEPIQPSEPETTEPEVTEPEAIEPELSQPEEPEPVEQPSAEPFEPEVNFPERSEPELSPKPEAVDTPTESEEPSLPIIEPAPTSEDDGDRPLDQPMTTPTPSTNKPKSLFDRFRKPKAPAIAKPAPAIEEDSKPIEHESPQSEATDQETAPTEPQPAPFSIDDLITPSEEPAPVQVPPAPISEPEETPSSAPTFAPPTATRAKPKTNAPNIKDFLKRFQPKQPPASDSPINQPIEVDNFETEVPEASEPSDFEIPSVLEAPEPLQSVEER